MSACTICAIRTGGHGSIMCAILRIDGSCLSEKKMYKNKIKRTHRRTTETGPWQKLADLLPFKLKSVKRVQFIWVYVWSKET